MDEGEKRDPNGLINSAPDEIFLGGSQQSGSESDQGTQARTDDPKISVQVNVSITRGQNSNQKQ